MWCVALSVLCVMVQFGLASAVTAQKLQVMDAATYDGISGIVVYINSVRHGM